MNQKKHKVGDTVWLLDRKRVRDGTGPSRVTISSVSPLGWCSVVGNRGTYHVSDLHETEGLANLAWTERAQAELAVEQARHNKIASKLQRALRPT